MEQDKKEIEFIETVRNMSNKELIEGFKLFSDHSNYIINEFYIRYQSDTVTDDELKIFKDIGDNLTYSFKTRF